MSSIGIEADLSGIGVFIGSVGGILDAIQSPAFKGDFIGTIMDDIDVKFMADSIANRGNIAHVFEWPDVAGAEPSSEPLFRLLHNGYGDTRYLSFEFLPSNKNVPLPDPARYGFNPDKLQYLKNHVFRMKAIVMETQSTVTIAPKGDNKLFIPSADSPKGYFMTSHPVSVNPGGTNATGTFAEWWNSWFESRAPQIVYNKTKLEEELIKATGQTIIRDSLGRFARGSAVSFGYIDAAKHAASAEFIAMTRRSR